MPRGRPRSCECGTCKRCEQIEYQRLYQAEWRKRNPDYHRRYWERRSPVSMFTPEEDELLGIATDSEVAQMIGRSSRAVAKRRVRLGVPRFQKAPKPVRSPRPNVKGYVIVHLKPSDPLFGMCRTRGAVMEHRLVMARHLGRPLLSDEIVHHRNGMRHDNRIENLELWTRSHPDGQRVEDVFEWCVEFIEKYSGAFFHRKEPA